MNEDGGKGEMKPREFGWRTTEKGEKKQKLK